MNTTTTLKTFVKENTWLSPPLLTHGWGNGYVCIPPDHPLHGEHYDEIHQLIPDLSVNGGLTFARAGSELKSWPEMPEGCDNDWVVGFDTCHSWDDRDIWPDAGSVQRETNKLAEQLKTLDEMASEVIRIWKEEQL